MNKKNIGYLWKYILKNKGLVLVAVCCTLVVVLLSLITPLIISFTVDSVLDDKPLTAPVVIAQWFDNAGIRSVLTYNMWICGLAIVAVMLVQGLFMFLRGRSIAKASENIARDMREQVFDHLQKLSYEYHVGAETGDLIQRCTTDVETIRRFISVQLVETVRAIGLLGVAFTIMVLLHWQMALISISVVPVILAFSIIYFKKIQHQFTIVEKADGHMSTVLQENLTGVRVVRAFGRQAAESDKFATANTDFRVKSQNLIRKMAGFWGLSRLPFGYVTTV